MNRNLVAVLSVALASMPPAERALAFQAATTAPPPIRVAVARMTHGHIGRLWTMKHPEIQVVGIFEPNEALVERLAKQYGFDRRLVFTDMATMLDVSKPDAVVAFGATSEHLSVVEAAAPRGIHVMVEKPLAVSTKDARRIEALAQRHHVTVLTNYETTWYPSMHAAKQLVQGDTVIGPLRKMVVHDGHSGPREIGVGPEFLAWLTDPVQNGAGALFDFGCYGANLATWFMNGEAPATVTAVTQQLKPDVYPRVDDEATIVLTYRHAQAILQASWNWPVSRKDMELYGKTGYLLAPNATTLRVRRAQDTPENAITPEPASSPWQNEWQYLAAVVRGTVHVSETDLASLTNNVTVVRILDAARQSAITGRTVRLDGKVR